MLLAPPYGHMRPSSQPFRKAGAQREVTVTLALAAEYGIAICIAAIALIGLSSVARLAALRRSSSRRMPTATRVDVAVFGRNDIR